MEQNEFYYPNFSVSLVTFCTTEIFLRLAYALLCESLSGKLGIYLGTSSSHSKPKDPFNSILHSLIQVFSGQIAIFLIDIEWQVEN